VRPYRLGDEVELAALASQALGREVTAEWWMWKLKGAASPVENVWVGVSRDGGEIVGQYAGIPVRLKPGDNVRDAMVLAASLITPDLRHGEALAQLEAVAHDAWAAAGVAAVLQLSNQQSESRTTAPGWVRLFPLTSLRLPLRLDVMAANSGKVPAPFLPPVRAIGALVSRISRARWQRKTWRSAGVSIEEVTSIASLPAFDALWARLSGQYRDMIVRDGEWVRWRYLEAVGGNRYRVLLARTEKEPAGYLVYHIDGMGRGTSYIDDMFTAPENYNVARALLGTALDDLWRRKLGSVMAATAPTGSLDRLLRTIGFRQVHAEGSVQILSLDPAIELTALSSPRMWHLTGGDFSLIS
jgi:hypothetical protein